MDLSITLLRTMQRGTPFRLQVQVPSDLAAIAIITLHPAGRDAQSRTYQQKHLWAISLASSLRQQDTLQPLLVYCGELSFHLHNSFQMVKSNIAHPACIDTMVTKGPLLQPM